jgi:hypothetical protein
MLLSPLGERLGEGVMPETIFGLTPSPNLSPKGGRNMTRDLGPRYASGSAVACLTGRKANELLIWARPGILVKSMTKRS